MTSFLKVKVCLQQPNEKLKKSAQLGSSKFISSEKILNVEKEEVI
jgi:hypothetical protein